MNLSKHVQFRYKLAQQYNINPRILIATLLTQMDMYIRLRALEGVAQVDRGTWSKMPSMKLGLIRAQAELQKQGVSPNPNWFVTTDTGVYKNLVENADKILINVNDVSGEDIINDMLVGAGESGEDQAYYFGKTNRDKIINIPSSLRLMRNTLANFARKKAMNVLDALKRKHRHFEKQVNLDQIPKSEEGRAPEISEEDKIEQQDVSFGSYIQLVMTDPYDFLGTKMKQVIEHILHKLEQNTRNKEVALIGRIWMTLFFEDPKLVRRGIARRVLKTLQDQFGKTKQEATIRQQLKKFFTLFAKEFNANTEAQKTLNQLIDKHHITVSLEKGIRLSYQRTHLPLQILKEASAHVGQHIATVGNRTFRTDKMKVTCNGDTLGRVLAAKEGLRGWVYALDSTATPYLKHGSVWFFSNDLS